MIKIGDVEIKSRLVLAPMAGITDVAYRVLCKRFGCGLVYTEMINANALVRNNKATIRMAALAEEERPVAVQIFGSREDVMVDAAKIVESKGADIIDINLGCPDAKVIRQGAGSALLVRPKKMSELVTAIVKKVKVPVTAKIRLGMSTKEGLKTAKIIEEAGVSAVAVHARTAKQGYSGKADYAAIREIKENIKIPVIGSGDVFCGKDAKRMIDETHCDLVMVGRAAIGNPHIFKEIGDYLEGKEEKQMSPKEKLNLFFDYLTLAERYDCFNPASAKVLAISFTKGIPHSCRPRGEMSSAKTLDDIKAIIRRFYDRV